MLVPLSGVNLNVVLQTISSFRVHLYGNEIVTNTPFLDKCCSTSGFTVLVQRFQAVDLFIPIPRRLETRKKFP